ncbi:glycosyltransferase, partial [Rhizobiales bacterium L72]|nr:glycosyltransferase [Propylenella binzhouense]
MLATSHATAATLTRDFGVPAEKIAIAVPGTDPGPPARGGHRPPRLVAVGSLVPRKGHDVLIAALDRIRALPWSCRIAGSPHLAPEWAGGLAAEVRRLGLSGRIALLGACADARGLMAQSDIFVLPSRYEGYGMVFAEALAQGLPVVACRAGAVPDVVPETAGMLVPPDDPAALAAALGRLLGDDALRSRYAAGARAGSRSRPARWRARKG